MVFAYLIFIFYYLTLNDVDAQTGYCILAPALIIGGSLNYNQGGQWGPWPPGTYVQLSCNSGWETLKIITIPSISIANV